MITAVAVIFGFSLSVLAGEFVSKIELYAQAEKGPTGIGEYYWAAHKVVFLNIEDVPTACKDGGFVFDGDHELLEMLKFAALQRDSFGKKFRVKIVTSEDMGEGRFHGLQQNSTCRVVSVGY